MRDRRVGGLLVALALGCGAGEPEPGNLALEWTGVESGRLEMPAQATDCREGNWLELVATAGDTGVALVLYPADTTLSGTYPINDPVDSLGEGAALAMRWFASAAVFGLQSRAGSLRVERQSSGRLRGRFHARLVSVMRPDTFEAQGAFRGIAVTPGAAGCSRPAGQVTPDSSVD